MPRINLRSVPLPSDPDEEPLREVARAAGVSVRLNGVARRSGQPHIELYARPGSDQLLASFGRAAQAIRWLESTGGAHAPAP